MGFIIFELVSPSSNNLPKLGVMANRFKAAKITIIRNNPILTENKIPYCEVKIRVILAIPTKKYEFTNPLKMIVATIIDPKPENLERASKVSN